MARSKHDAHMTPATISALEQEVAFLVRGLECLYRRRKYPVERAQYLLMLQLLDGPRSSGELAARLRLDHSTVTRQIAALEEKGCLVRSPNPDDGRSVLIALSDLGLMRCSQMRKVRTRGLEAMLSGWSEADRVQFANLVGRFNDAVREVGMSPFEEELQRLETTDGTPEHSRSAQE